MLWRIAPRIINGDKVFWQRCTGSLLYGAAVRVSSGSGAELTDFRLLHSENLAGRELPYGAAWTPESGDTAREAEFSFPAADVTEIRLYDNPSPEDNVLTAEIVFPSGNRYAVGALDPAGTLVPVDEPDCEGFTVRLLETEGEHAGLTEAEAYSGAHDVMPPLIKLTDGDGNFIYDYRLSRGETEAVLSLYALSASDDLTGYTVTCEGEGCAAAGPGRRAFRDLPARKELHRHGDGRNGYAFGQRIRCARDRHHSLCQRDRELLRERHPENEPLFSRRALLQTLHPRLGIKNLPADTLSAGSFLHYRVGFV